MPSLAAELRMYRFDAAGTGLSIAILAYPHISNLDEFAALQRVPGAPLCWTRQARTILEADLLILRGSKQEGDDLA